MRPLRRGCCAAGRRWSSDPSCRAKIPSAPAQHPRGASHRNDQASHGNGRAFLDTIGPCMETTGPPMQTIGPGPQAIARSADGFSGSDLHQLCATAASMPIMEMVRAGAAVPRPLTVEDFRSALLSLQAPVPPPLPFLFSPSNLAPPSLPCSPRDLLAHWNVSKHAHSRQTQQVMSPLHPRALHGGRLQGH